MSSSRAALAFSLAEKYTSFAIGLVSTIVLARLLTPAEIGTYSVAYSVFTIGHVLRELGVGEYVIQERELSRDRLRAALFISILMATIAAAVLAASSDIIATFYGQAVLRDIALLLALNMLLIPFGAITLAYLRRELRFGRVLVISSLNSLVGVAVSLSLAASGHGALSLAWGSVAGMLATVISSVLLRPAELPWLPGTRELRRVLGVGSYVTAAHAAGAVSRATPDLVIGKVLGVTDTGIFSKAVGVVDTFSRTVLQAALSIALPHFSSRVRSGGDVRADYITAVELLTGLAWPFFAVLALAAAPTIRLLLGDQWDEAIPIARILCASGAISVSFAAFSHLLLSSEGAPAYAKFAVVSALVRVGAVFAAVWFGLAAIAWGLVVANFLSGVISLRMLSSRFGIRSSTVMTACRSSLLMTIAAVAPASLAINLVGDASTLAQLAAVALSAGTGYLFATAALGHPLLGEALYAYRAISSKIRNL